MTTCIAGTPQYDTATPGSTEWIKAHLARMDDRRAAPATEDVASGEMLEASR
ncbi:hypothetical protein OED52_17910 [Rhodococcus sp. Z13]|uniref:Uncharacterized protein n=1 Tax=Rhodococcus sacchari TaxID=2962047 RepID=A0ACD4DES6_9NOCA|nr:hypothetical protein [Rhodococcus sp. Z13]UYP18507.1 hypothetical protein OED52_17910 [Rhodococcus sp. Z13]